MRAGFTDQTEHHIALSDANQRRLEKLARRYGVEPSVLLEQGLSALLENGVFPTPKEGRVLPFKALKSEQKGSSKS